MIRLGVNIDHVATVRQARRANEPDPVAAALLAMLGGADGITVHLREDRRHIQDRDVRLLRPIVTRRLNLELAATDEIVTIACEIKPDEATLVPERRQEVTTEGGLDVLANQDAVGKAIERLKAANIEARPLPGRGRRGNSNGQLFRSAHSRGSSPAAKNVGRCSHLQQGTRLAPAHGARAHLHKHSTHLQNHRPGGVEYRPQHHFPSRLSRHGTCGARDEGSNWGRDKIAYCRFKATRVLPVSRNGPGWHPRLAPSFEGSMCQWPGRTGCNRQSRAVDRKRCVAFTGHPRTSPGARRGEPRFRHPAAPLAVKFSATTGRLGIGLPEELRVTALAKMFM